MSAEVRKGRLRRLDQVFVRSPIYFVTACTQNRLDILTTPAIHETFRRFGQEGPSHGAWVGAYVIMPDHLHLFVATNDEKIAISAWMKSLKNTISKTENILRSPASEYRIVFRKVELCSRESGAGGTRSTR